MSVEFKADVDYFGQAHSGVRDPHETQLIVVHTTENPDHATVDDIAKWQLDTTNGSSYNLLVGTGGRSARSNSDRFSPWSAGSPGNRIGLHVSAVGFASRDRAHWMRLPEQLDGIAEIVADWHTRYGHPLEWLSPAQISAGQRGVTSHENLYLAFGGPAGRTDPGAGFPHDVVLESARRIVNPEEGALMALTGDEQRELLDMNRRMYRELTQLYPSRSQYRVDDAPVDTLAGTILNIDGRAHEGHIKGIARELDKTPEQVAEAIRKSVKEARR